MNTYKLKLINEQIREISLQRTQTSVSQCELCFDFRRENYLLKQQLLTFEEQTEENNRLLLQLKAMKQLYALKCQQTDLLSRKYQQLKAERDKDKQDRELFDKETITYFQNLIQIRIFIRILIRILYVINQMKSIYPKVSAFGENKDWRRGLFEPSEREKILQTRLQAMVSERSQSRTPNGKANTLHTSVGNSTFNKYVLGSDDTAQSQTFFAQIHTIADLTSRICRTQPICSNDEKELLDFIKSNLSRLLAN